MLQNLDQSYRSVRVATRLNLSLSGLQTVDGVTLTAGDRVLVAGQNDSTQNGIYVAATGSWQRAFDFPVGSRLPAGLSVVVEEGAANKGRVFWVASTSTVGSPTQWMTSQLSAGLSRSPGYLSAPGWTFSATATQSLLVGVRYFYRLFFDAPMTVNSIACEVTTGGSGNIRLGLIAADQDWQPTGPVLADSGDIDATTAAVKSYTLPTPVTCSGRVLVLLHTGVACTIREMSGGLASPDLMTTLGANAVISRRSRLMAYAPLDASPWNATNTANVERLGVFVNISNPTP